MKDSRIKSLTEATFNIIVGFIINFIANIIILPLFGMPLNLINFGIIGILYTIISLLRSYMLRRLFVNGFYEDVVLKLFKNYFKNERDKKSRGKQS